MERGGGERRGKIKAKEEDQERGEMTSESRTVRERTREMLLLYRETKNVEP